MAQGIAITVEQVSKSFAGGRVRALDGVDLEIATGEWIAVTGATGSGKSTLLALLALLEEADTGSIRFDGRPSAELRPFEGWRARNLGIVFQFHHLLPHLTLLENVQLPLLQPGNGWRDSMERSIAALDQVDLAHRATVLAAHVSGGERQLCAVARALVVQPRLVLADEPTGNVDPETGERVIDLLSGWSREAGATLLTITHQPDLARRADRVVTLAAGRLLAN
ncbi:MAG: ATP-binding cassette domain-containing protein [Thermoanaerobaculales bacterium]|nr:ATP-binding cassette domain-containing protein [Thermoanaerobaculales bacterium]